MSDHDEPPRPDRRDAALNLAIAATAGTATVLGAWPVARFVAPPEEVVDARRVVVGKREDFAPDTVKLVRRASLPVLIVADRAGALRAYDARCTHLGCTLGYDRGHRHLACACHGGRFALDGRVIAGPPPRDLRVLTVRTVGDDVIVEDV
jgi:Rieske Fe-S protein